jgi:16S rRNA (adenine1518-N6/adenine1519-N6)-dimethyltransferase
MTSPRTILAAWDLHAKKQFGQNFLVDPAVPAMIVSKARITANDNILEIGAGLGALTIPLARTAASVHTVERDNNLVPLLRNELLAAGVMDKVDIIHNDILEVDLPAIAEKSGGPIIVMGNLPYNISSQILIWLVRSRHAVSRAVFMFQKELADRIAAPPGSRDYGRLSAVIQYCATIHSVVRIDASQFFPRPKVDSEVIEIVFRSPPPFPADDEDFLFAVIKAAFGQRRKNLKNALSGSQLELPSDIILNALTSAGIDHHRRAETLTVEEFVRLSHHLRPRK